MVDSLNLILFPLLYNISKVMNETKRKQYFFRYVNASVISFKLHFTAILFHLSGLRLFPLNLVCLFVCFFFPLQI